MPFEVRLAGKLVATFDSEAAAVARAREMLRQDADRQPEVLDTATGRAVAPGASAESRERLAGKIGF
jgi:hypothetical protein